MLPQIAEVLKDSLVLSRDGGMDLYDSPLRRPIIVPIAIVAPI